MRKRSGVDNTPNNSAADANTRETEAGAQCASIRACEELDRLLLDIVSPARARAPELA
jgi:hypothetical protein